MNQGCAEPDLDSQGPSALGVIDAMIDHRYMPLTSMDDAITRVGAVDTLAVPLATGIPGGFLHALGERSDFDDLQVFGALLNDLYGLFMLPGVRYRSGFYGPAERVLRELGAAMEYVPADFRRFAPILEAQRPRVMATAAAPPDAEGWMSLSLHAGATVAELERCASAEDRVLVVEYSRAYPTTLGLPPEHPHRIHVDEADVVVETDRTPVVIEDPPPDDVDRAIAAYATSFVSDGCTLQTGIGSIPSVIAGLLAEGSGGDYGVHSEMFTTGLMRLHQAGKVTNRKGRFDGCSVTTFAAGNAELYEWLDGNTEVRFLPVDIVNSPEIIAANRRMITINGALAVDLKGQVVADTIDGRQFSGIGGHEDFLAGPGLRLEDRSLLCLRSTAEVDGETRSRIVSELAAGSIVSTPRHQVDVVITEHGVAELEGRSVRERSEALAAIADSRFRDELLEEAARNGRD